MDVRLIAATNRNLSKAINMKEFREDLFYRLNVFPLRLSPLRDRKGDIPVLVQHFVNKLSTKLGKTIEKIPQSVLNNLQNYSWPGNVRELENIIERAMILSFNNTLIIENLQELDAGSHASEQLSSNSRLQDVERSHILQILEESNWVIEGKRGAAVRLGLHSSTLRDRMKKMGIKRPK